MRLDPDGSIVLSRRNVLALLHKLDKVGSARTLISPGGAFVLKVEDDAEHYGDRVPGVMTEDTEAFIRNRS